MLKILSLLLACLVAAPALATDPPPANMHAFERHVRVDVAVREITLEGMRARLALLATGASAAADDALDSDIQQRIATHYEASGTSASRHAAYGTRFAEGIAAWLDEHPEWRSRYVELDAEFRTLSSQFSATR